MFISNPSLKAIPLLLLVLLPPLAADEAPMSVFFEEAVAAAIQHPSPEYNSVATQLKLSGLVEVAAFVDTEGNVYDTIIITGNPVLTHLAVDAVKHWKFRPFHDEHGKIVKAMAYLKFVMEPPKKQLK